MTRRAYWGIATLIILLIGISAVLLMRNTDTEPEIVINDVSDEQIAKIHSQSKPTQKLVKKVDRQPPPGASPHGHWHDDEWHNEPHVPIGSLPTVQRPDSNAPTEPMIYPHQKLLDTHPVAALRAQAKESGHWSAKYIPPFPADDVEANELARNYYIKNYHEKRGDYYHPDAVKASEAITKWRNDNGTYSITEIDIRESRPRFYDLFRLSWTRSDNYGSGEFTWNNLAWEIESNFTKEDYINAGIQ